MKTPLLDGTIVGLLILFAPVVFTGDSLAPESGEKGVVVAVPTSDAEPGYSWPEPDHVLVTWFGSDCGSPPDERPLRTLSLDLREKTGRAIVRWWLSAHLSPSWGTPPDFQDSFKAGRVGWWLNHQQHFVAKSEEVGDIVVPGLAFLDPKDDRRLEDGTRWVDAEALRLCAVFLWEQKLSKGVSRV